jgi:hypothetical protein
MLRLFLFLLLGRGLVLGLLGLGGRAGRRRGRRGDMTWWLGEEEKYYGRFAIYSG